MDRVEARRRITAAEKGPGLSVDISVLVFGNVALVGIPGEYFSELGRDIKLRSPFDYTMIITLSDGGRGYIPARHNYDEGGYEVTSTILEPGAGEQMADTAVKMLDEAKARD